MFTYKDKEREASIIRINRAVFAIFMASVLICSGFFALSELSPSPREGAHRGLERTACPARPTRQPGPTHEDVQPRSASDRQLSRVYADRYLGMVLISELAALTPPNIRFLDLKINLGPVAGPAIKTQLSKETGKEKEKAPPRIEEVTVEGLILGERQTFETSLAGYLMTLESSPLFQQVNDPEEHR